MKQLLLIIGIILLTIYLSSCRKSPEFDQQSSDFVVVTNRYPAADFTIYKTCFISDTVANLGGTGSDSIITDQTATRLAGAVKANMRNLGYILVDHDSLPDIGIKIGVVKSTTTVLAPGWWDAFAGWPAPIYWGFPFPYFYSWTNTYGYTAGTVIVNMYDLKHAAANKKIIAIWNNINFGALSNNISDSIGHAIDAINQGFSQSPYLKTN